MAHAKKTLEPGTWYAGYHAPFFVSRALVAAALGKLGLRDIRFFDRFAQTENSVMHTALPVDPKLDPAYDDKWDTWLEATYAGPSKPVDVPAQVSWLLHSSAAETSPAGPLAPAKATSPKPELSKGLLFLLVLYLLSEE